MMSDMTMSRVEQWERRSEVPLLLLAGAFLVAYVWPVTLEGRLIAFALMLVGISLVGVVTASVAAWLVANVERPADRADAGPAADRQT
jgi:hypothetical protein